MHHCAMPAKLYICSLLVDHGIALHCKCKQFTFFYKNGNMHYMYAKIWDLHIRFTACGASILPLSHSSKPHSVVQETATNSGI